MSLIVDGNALHRIALADRPLIVCDVDEVVLEFITPFRAYLATRGYAWLARSFRLSGNIVALGDRTQASPATIRALREAFFASQRTYQTPVRDAAASLDRLSTIGDIVFLTAMPPRHAEIRRALLDVHGLTYPMIATEEAKGPLVAALHRHRPVPAVFLDDIFTNLQSVRDHLPSALLINLIANTEFRALAPDPGEGIVTVQSWTSAETVIRRHIDTGTAARPEHPPTTGSA